MGGYYLYIGVNAVSNGVQVVLKRVHKIEAYCVSERVSKMTTEVNIDWAYIDALSVTYEVM